MVQKYSKAKLCASRKNGMFLSVTVLFRTKTTGQKEILYMTKR